MTHYWQTACKTLSKGDPVLRAIIKEYSGSILRKRGSAFETLARAIVGQQISVKAARTIWDRLLGKVNRVTPKEILALTSKQLRACGLSERKAEYIRDLAKHFTTGKISPRKFKSMSDEDLIQSLCDVRGIGRWTAEMFLIFELHRPDVYPVDDIGLIRAVERRYFDGRKVSKAEIIEIGQRWRPWRSVATWYLWRSLDPKPVEY